MDEFKNMDKLKDELFEAIDKICKDYESKHEPEFKVPGWHYHPDNDEMFYVYKIENGHVYAEGIIFDIDSPYYKHCITPSPEKIESYLKPICDKKYVGKRILVQTFKDGTSDIVNEFLSYEPEEDTIRYQGIKNYILYPYKQGKFASIIPGKKKPPETREEFEKFLVDYNEYDDNNYRDHYKFLDQYEIQ